MEKSILDPQMVEFVKFAKNFTSPKDPQKAWELFIAKKSEYKANDLFVRVNGSGYWEMWYRVGGPESLAP